MAYVRSGRSQRFGKHALVLWLRRCANGEHWLRRATIGRRLPGAARFPQDLLSGTLARSRFTFNAFLSDREVSHRSTPCPALNADCQLCR